MTPPLCPSGYDCNFEWNTWQSSGSAPAYQISNNPTWYAIQFLKG